MYITNKLLSTVMTFLSLVGLLFLWLELGSGINNTYYQRWQNYYQLQLEDNPYIWDWSSEISSLTLSKPFERPLSIPLEKFTFSWLKITFAPDQTIHFYNILLHYPDANPRALEQEYRMIMPIHPKNTILKSKEWSSSCLAISHYPVSPNIAPECHHITLPLDTTLLYHNQKQGHYLNFYFEAITNLQESVDGRRSFSLEPIKSIAISALE